MAGEGALALRRLRMRAGYDLAETTDENRRLYERVDSLATDAWMSPEKRRVLRNRCRYESANNSYARGIGLTLANDTIGTGPQLQLLGGNTDENRKREQMWWDWATEIRLPQKLRTMRFAKFEGGEIFAVIFTNEALRSPIKLDFELVEAEQIDDPEFTTITDENWQDGIRYDDSGNPVRYRKLDHHPGSLGWVGLPTDYTDVDARWVFHYFTPTRPCQRRGIPDLTPACQLFGELRRYRGAVLMAAETASAIAAFITSDAPADSEGGPTTVEAMDQIEYARGMLMTLPQGSNVNQLKAEQPTTTHDAFTSTLIREAARCLNVPFTVAVMDASVANMSATYVDRQVYGHERMIDRAELERFIEQLFREWTAEARFVVDLPDEIPHQWFWPSLGHHADPAKVANAVTTKLAYGMTNFPLEYAREGLDWEEQQQAAAKSLGIEVKEYRELLKQKIFGAPKAMAQGDTPPEPDEEEPPTRQESRFNGNNHPALG